ncbi:MAG TPA: LPS export ABC transporter periplasmic protein LptC [Gemmatimonadales bacterium]|nr:LPS export ABC transporter periplasmic protein LptC [Gemmatimonadales bacterium]
MNRSLRTGLWSLQCALVVTLLGCPSSGVTPTATTAIPDSADMVLFDMERGLFQDGVRRAVILADTAFVYQNSQITELRNLRMTFFDAAGNQTSVLTSLEATYQIQHESLDARRDVVVVTTEGKRLTTQHLIYDKPGNLIRTDSAFTYNSSTEQLRGNGFRADPEFSYVTVQQPAGRQREGGILLPGQVP